MLLEICQIIAELNFHLFRLACRYWFMLLLYHRLINYLCQEIHRLLSRSLAFELVEQPCLLLGEMSAWKYISWNLACVKALRVMAVSLVKAKKLFLSDLFWFFPVGRKDGRYERTCIGGCKLCSMLWTVQLESVFQQPEKELLWPYICLLSS